MCHVLVIEDELLIALDIQDMVEAAGGTSFDFASTEDEAVRCACANPPALITSDVKLLEGSGPNAVLRIFEACGPRPVIFITATPEACKPCDEPAVVLAKPVSKHQLHDAFARLHPLAA